MPDEEAHRAVFVVTRLAGSFLLAKSTEFVRLFVDCYLSSFRQRILIGKLFDVSEINTMNKLTAIYLKYLTSFYCLR